MFSVLTSKLFGGAAIALAVALAFTVGMYEAKVDVYAGELGKADDKIDGLQSDIAALRLNNASLDSGLKQCNTSVDQLASVASAVNRNSAAALAAATAGRGKVVERIQIIKQMPTNSCADVTAILKQGAVQ